MKDKMRQSIAKGVQNMKDMPTYNMSETLMNLPSIPHFDMPKKGHHYNEDEWKKISVSGWPRCSP